MLYCKGFIENRPKGEIIMKFVIQRVSESTVKVHGEIILHYTVYTEKGIILLTNITPEGILDEGHRAELSTYKGVMISKTNPEKDMFKINLLNMLGK